MLKSLIKLFVPLNYLRIQHACMKYFNFVIPLIIATFTILIFILLSDTSAKLTGQNSFISVITEFLKILTGFYIAALAAVATFNKPDMDELMEGEPPKLKIKFREKTQIIDLTRRRFLCYLFGYLSFLSIVIYLGGEFSFYLPNVYCIIFSSKCYIYIKYLSLFIYLFAFWNLITNTLLGLYYLTDRMHR